MQIDIWPEGKTSVHQTNTVSFLDASCHIQVIIRRQTQKVARLKKTKAMQPEKY